METLLRQLAIFNDLNPNNQSLHHMQVFVFIAQRGSCIYQDIEKFFHVSNASASRTVRSLDSFSPHRKIGLGLVERVPDPGEGRRYRVQLTKKGQLVYDQLLAA